jgi:hypothetical protein
MKKLDEFVKLLTPEEFDWFKKLTDMLKDDLREMTPEEAEKKIAQRTVYEYRLMDKQGILTLEQDRRWRELQEKLKELGLARA